jgi:hypothetical protein
MNPGYDRVFISQAAAMTKDPGFSIRQGGDARQNSFLHTYNRTDPKIIYQIRRMEAGKYRNT